MDIVSHSGTLLGWWHEISLAEQLFFAIALLTGFVILILGAISIFGIEFHDADVDSFDSDISGNSLFSIKSITGAFFAFGWAGGASMDCGLGLGLSVIIALAAGFTALLIVAGILRATRHLRANGNLQKSQSVGKVATVYVTIPPSGKGAGQVTVPLDGRTITMGAVQAGDLPIPSGAKVTVLEMIDDNTVRIQSIS
jgi:hypothetical protein